jgi:hypothetical protein
VIALIGFHKKTIGDMFYASAAARGEALVDAWLRQMGSCNGRILGRWLDLGLWRRHDQHPCLSRWLTGCW